MAYTCGATGCTAAATLQWQKYLANGTDAVPVFACDTHKVSPSLATGIHASVCTAPPTCNCSGSFPVYPKPGH